jgi:hypothetical protein
MVHTDWEGAMNLDKVDGSPSPAMTMWKVTAKGRRYHTDLTAPSWRIATTLKLAIGRWITLSVGRAPHGRVASAASVDIDAERS